MKIEMFDPARCILFHLIENPAWTVLNTRRNSLTYGTQESKSSLASEVNSGLNTVRVSIS